MTHAAVLLSYLPPRGEGTWFIRVDTLHTCDIRPCQEKARFDARLHPGTRWGYVCQRHAREFQVSLGTGRGQLLLLPEEEFIPQEGQV